MRFAELQDAAIVGHSLGNDLARLCRTYPDGYLALPCWMGLPVALASAPIHEQMSRWIDQIDRIGEREPSAFRTIDERLSDCRRAKAADTGAGAASCPARVRKDSDNLYHWKFDPYQRAGAPYRLSSDDMSALWSRIICPTLLMWATKLSA